MNTKNKLSSGVLAALVSAVFCVPVANAGTYTLDTFLGSSDLGNSSDAAELAEMETQAGVFDLTLDFKIDVFDVLSNGGTEWYIDVAPLEPGYFMLKFGTGNTGFDNHYFFQNIGELDKLVWSGTDVNGLSGKLSHYNGFTAPIPEPETYAMFLAGLGLMGFMARRRSKTS